MDGTTSQKHAIDDQDMVNEGIKKQKREIVINEAVNEEKGDEFDDLEDFVEIEKNQVKFTDSDMYLDTINRKILNFDLPLICSVSLATTNIHICLVCNKYLQGASESSPAYAHAADTNHHIFLNTSTSKFIILPEQLILSDNMTYELHDIQLLLKPEFTTKMISDLDTTPIQSETLNKTKYNPGFIPLVNDSVSDIPNSRISEQRNFTLKHNSLYYALAHLPFIRDKLLAYEQTETTPLTNELSILTKKIWSPYLFKNFTSSYIIENYLVSCHLSNKITVDLRLFYIWVINSLNKENKKLFKDCFSGKILIDMNKETKFINLPIKLPQQSVFKGSTSLSIEQYDLEKLLKEKNLKMVKSPKYLVLYVDRRNDMNLEGIEQKLNMNIVKFNPDLLQINSTLKYKLIANITYDNRVHVLDLSRNTWMQFDGINVKEIQKELLFLSNCELQFWELID